MIRDFEQVKGDVSCWLRHRSPRARLSSKNPAQQFGRLRMDKDFQPNPAVCMQAFELRSFAGGTLMFAGIQVMAVDNEGQALPTNMAWDGLTTCFTSPILGNNMRPQRIGEISGIFLDRLYAQIAFPMQNALNDL